MGNDTMVAVTQAEEWLRAISDWLIANDHDMMLPSGVLDADPLDIADALACHRRQSGRTGAGEALRALREDHRKLALFHASGGTEVSWEEVDTIVSAALQSTPGDTK